MAKIKVTVKKNSEVAKLLNDIKTEKQNFKHMTEPGNKQQTAVEWLEMQYHKKGYALSSNDFQEAKKMEKEQTEISDEEIEESNPFRIDGGAYNSSAAYQWLKGAKWYREQLKKK